MPTKQFEKGNNYTFADLPLHRNKRHFPFPCSFYWQKQRTTLQAVVTSNFLLYKHFSHTLNGLEVGEQGRLNARLFYEA